MTSWGLSLDVVEYLLCCILLAKEVTRPVKGRRMAGGAKSHCRGQESREEKN